MARPKRTTKQEFYDVFADFDVTDQGIVLEFLTELHRQAKRQSVRLASRAGGTGDAEAAAAVSDPDSRPWIDGMDGAPR